MHNVLKMICTFTLALAHALPCLAEECQNADYFNSINGIKLLDYASYKNIVGNDTRFYESENTLFTQYYNKTGDEMLTIISLPKERFCATKFKVVKVEKKYLMKRKVIRHIDRFSTEKGVHLGMTPETVSGILGSGFNKVVRKDGVIIYRFSKTNTNEDISNNDRKAAKEASEYFFYRNKLVEFVLSSQ